MNPTRPPSAADPAYRDHATDRPLRSVTLILFAVFVAFFITGLAMPVLPLHVHTGLGMSTLIVGFVTGSQFAAALISRVWSGNYADSRGGKPALLAGLVAAIVSGLLYLASLPLAGAPVLSVTLLLLGRAVLGGAEGFIITGAFSWALMMLGPQSTGRILSWIGIAMYSAFAIAAPIGASLYSRYGFLAIGLGTVLLPLASLLLTYPMRFVAPRPARRPPLIQVIGAVWLPGIGLAFASVGFAAINAFVSLFFVERGWGPVWLVFTIYSGSFMLSRVLFGHLPDKLGATKVALLFVSMEATGQAVIWLAPQPEIAFLGVALTGFGYSLVHPAFGVEAVMQAPLQSRSLAMGAYTTFLDLALGTAAPVLGFVANRGGLRSVYLASTLVVACAIIVAIALLCRRKDPEPLSP
ncbi:arabinose transporter [Rhizobium sp. CB3090]|uniref:arabinose transporter n=1 Tax=Rhizobium sp. CB3090 TaxID=3039156 RepID=UPI0024B16F06|nr:arabinose transporter [Rhizobium sp. CB3090]WFU07788.1 arabinose transporter [Rhizobium sp. CB3090]